VRSLTLSVRPPFSLGLTVAVLRRLPTNRVDVLADDGAYFRAFQLDDGPLAMRVESLARDRLRVRFDRDVPDRAVWAARVRRRLGLEVDLDAFYRVAREVPRFDALVRQMRGVRPPRYPTLWEAIVNAVVFQQVSLASAMATMGRFVERFGVEHRAFGQHLRPFPDAVRIAHASSRRFEGLGLSAAKVRTLRALAHRVSEGDPSEAELASRTSDEALNRLSQLPGIGPWSAALILLRGLGRLDVFPAGDSGAARGLVALFGPRLADARAGDRLLARIGPYRGMLYYHLLLDRLARAGMIGSPAATR
jgi:DNA-3-methyladenine glycosylase II